MPSFGTSRQVLSSRIFPSGTPARLCSPGNKSLSSRNSTSTRTVGLAGTKCLTVNFCLDDQLGAHWVYKESLRFATSPKADWGIAINIQELQPTSGLPLSVIKSFPVPCRDGWFSFSLVSFHAFFVDEIDVIILDIRDSKVLFQTNAGQLLYKGPGHFSPDGRFFACGTLWEGICLRENTSTGYVPRSNLRPRLPFNRFSFSPVAISILS